MQKKTRRWQITRRRRRRRGRRRRRAKSRTLWRWQEAVLEGTQAMHGQRSAPLLAQAQTRTLRGRRTTTARVWLPRGVWQSWRGRGQRAATYLRELASRWAH
jgi:hypothetical protein